MLFIFVSSVKKHFQTLTHLTPLQENPVGIRPADISKTRLDYPGYFGNMIDPSMTVPLSIWGSILNES